MGTLSSVAARCGAIVAVAVAACGIARAGEGPRLLSPRVCIDGLDNLHVRDSQLRWEHLAYERPSLHVGCKGVSDVNGVPWKDWSKSFPLQKIPRGSNIVFHPVRCRSNCVLVQSPSAANGWEAIY